jgi:uncharacterized protein YkwD
MPARRPFAGRETSVPRWPRAHLAVGLTAGAVALAWGLTTAPPAARATGGTFPNEPFNGMTITYDVQGAQLGTPLDQPGFTTRRTYHGRVVGPVLRVAGTVKQDWGYGASVRVTVQAGGEAKSFEASGSTPWTQAYDVSVPVPPGTTTGSVVVSMVGDYNAGTRGLVVAAYLDNNAPTDTPVPTSTPTPTPTPAYDLTVGDVEVTQLIQCLHPAVGANCADNSVELVQGKRAAVRVFPVVTADPTNAPKDGQAVTARLTLSGRDLAPVNPALLHDKPAAELRKDRDSTVNFHLPKDWTAQQRLTLKVTINPDRTLPETNYENNSKEVVVELKPRRKLTVRYFPVRLAQGNKLLSPDKTVIRTGQRIMQQWFPVADTGITYLPGVRLTYYQPFETVAASPPYTSTSRLLKWVDRQAAIAGLLGSPVDQYVAWIPMPNIAGGFWYGVSDPGWANPPGAGRAVVMRSYASAQYGLAHEVAHNLGARHPNKEPDGCGAADPGTDWPYANARIQEVGYDLWAAGNLGKVVPATWYDLMSYCSDTFKWLSPHTFSKLFAGLAPKGGGAVAEARPLAGPGDLALVGGTVHRDGRAELDPLVRVVGEDRAPLPPSTGPYCVELPSDSLGLTVTRCFNVDFLDDDQQPVEAETFLFTLPFPAGADRVRLTRAGSPVAERRASAHAPELRIDAPGAGAVWDGPRTLRWSASDADGDPLTFAVLYSPAGAAWQPLNGDLAATSLDVDFNDLPGGGAAHVRVLASDGFHTTVADAGPFLVPAKAPRPVILQPADGAVLGPSDGLTLLAGGDDPEEGELDEATMRWSSDRDGQLGTGAVVDVPRLSVGDHLISLSARDAAGQVGADTVLVHIRRTSVFLPVAAKASSVRPAVPPPAIAPRPTATRPASVEMARQVIVLVNQIRSRQGLPPLVEQASLRDAAEWYAGDMASGAYVDPDHYDRLGRDVEARVTALGYSHEGFVSWRAAENIAAGAGSAQAVVDDWMASSEHRANILDPALCETGVGYAYGAATAQRHYWAQDFGCRDSTVPTAPPTVKPTATAIRPTPVATATDTARPDTPTPAPTVTTVASATPSPSPTATLGGAPVTPTATPAPLYRDDFADPASGWGVLDEVDRRHAYLEGEYQLLLKQPQRFTAAAPGFRCTDCIVEVDARLAGAQQGALGIAFSVTDDWQLYQLMVTADQQFSLWKYTNGQWTALLPWTHHAALRPGPATNRLRVEHYGADIRLLANGEPLSSTWDFSLSGNLRVGLTAESHDQSPVDARFDNFVVYPPQGIFAARAADGSMAGH